MAERTRSPRFRALSTPRAWDAQALAQHLVPRRDRLVELLPRELAIARGLTRDQRELVVDEAIDFLVTQYDKPIFAEPEAERAFWAVAALRVRRTHDGRSATVRAGWQRVDVDDVDVADVGADPEAALVDRAERQAMIEFATTLTDRERVVLALKYGGEKEQGRVLIAKRLGVTSAEVRRCERAIARKLDRFVGILAAGTLCAHREPAVLALAAGEDLGELESAARAHLAYCPACRLRYVAELRQIRSGALQRRLAKLLPPVVGTEPRRRGGLLDILPDWLARPFSHEAVTTSTQLSVASRGIGAAATGKFAALCFGGVTVIGSVCLSAGLVDRPQRAPVHRHEAPARAQRHPAPRRPRRSLPTAGASRAANRTPTPTATPTPARTTRTRPSTASRAAHPAPTPTPAPTSHEQQTAISPPATTSTTQGGEFDPAPASAPAPAPAAAPAGATSEFP